MLPPTLSSQNVLPARSNCHSLQTFSNGARPSSAKVGAVFLVVVVS